MLFFSTELSNRLASSHKSISLNCFSNSCCWLAASWVTKKVILWMMLSVFIVVLSIFLLFSPAKIIFFRKFTI